MKLPFFRRLPMLRFRPLPWEYGVRNLLRRPGRGADLGGLTIVVLLVLVVAAFVRGLETTLAVSGDPRVAIIYSLGTAENVEYSSVPMSTVDPFEPASRASERHGQGRFRASCISGRRLRPAAAREPTMALVRGVTPAARFGAHQVQIVAGDGPPGTRCSSGGWPPPSSAGAKTSCTRQHAVSSRGRRGASAAVHRRRLGVRIGDVVPWRTCNRR